MITKIEVSNFKGFRSFSIEPKNMNLIIGANGTGKTNFADLMDFVSIACRFGMKPAAGKVRWTGRGANEASGSRATTVAHVYR